jgi:signal transduction histidine kinase
MITAVIHFTGGVESTLAPLYLLDLIAISIFGFERIAYLLSFEAGIFFLINSLLERFLIIKHYQLTFMPSSLYLNSSYAVSKAMGLFFASLLSIYIVSFLLQRMRDKQKQIEVLSKGQLDFMNAVMHEVKSPLTSIMGYAEMLSEQKLGPLSDPQKEPVEVINRQSRRILDMINDLLDLARIESGVFKLDKKPLSLIEVACKVIEEMEPSLDARKLVLVQEFDPAVPAVNVDEGKITEVFTNLLSNAAKFSNIGGKIFFSIAPQGTEVLVSIRDEGLGINPVDLPHIFEKFYRASKESMERKGTGLGLAICKTIVEAHGGKIWAVSAGFGQGAVFYFTLPL